MMKYLILPMIVTLMLVVESRGQACDLSEDYCARCPDHVMCVELESDCDYKTDVSLEPLTAAEAAFVVNATNQKRQLCASGKTKFPAAVKMSAVKSDCRLQHFAELNVAQCKMEHDSCRSTRDFPSAGQNLAWMAKTDSHYDRLEALQSAVDMWYNEIAKATISDINKLTGTQPHFEDIGHYVQLCQEEVQFIGCGISQYGEYDEEQEVDFLVTLVACDYSYGNMLGQSVYNTGTAASKCTTGKHKVFPALCAGTEKYP